MEKCLISVTQQLAIIRLAKAVLIKDAEFRKYCGLCIYLEQAIKKIYRDQQRDDFSYLSEFIPLFTRENAMQFGNAYSSYESISFWWNRDAEGATKRIAFLDWMEEGLLK